MLYTLLFTTMVLSSFRAAEGSPTLQEEYRGSYVPKTIEAWNGLQVVAPDTPYVAAAGRNKLYFIDTRVDAETAMHIKKQVEMALIPQPDDYVSIDEIAATAEIRNAQTNETVFVFDPVYARILFARGMNRHNPELKLPENPDPGDQLVTYDLGN